MGRQAFLVILGLVVASTLAYGQNPKYLQKLEQRINEAHETEKEPEVEDLEADDILLDRAINCVGRAFESGEARDLGDCLTNEHRVYLSIEAGGEKADHYGTSQLKFIFDRIFRETRTQSFRYDSRELERFDHAIAVLTAEWTYVILDRDEEVTEYLQFKLEKDTSAWRVLEIRSTSR